MKQEQRRRWEAEGVERSGQEEVGETEGRWPTAVGRIGVEADRVGEGRGQL